MRQLTLFLISILLPGGCATSTHSPSRVPSPAANAEAQAACASGDCSSLPEPSAGLTPKESCQVALLRQRCTATDSCILRCLLDSSGKNVGGGCFHVCGNIVVRVRGNLVACPRPWQPPPGWEACRQITAANEPDTPQ
jgi:hypothetical protein